MRYTIIPFVVVSLFSSPFHADAQIKQKANIEHATVFLNGAELHSTAKLTLPQGVSEVIFSNVAGNVNQQSLTINADHEVVVQSAIFQNNYLQEDVASPVVKALNDSLQHLHEKWSALDDKIAAINEQISILTENRKVTGEHSGLSVAELQRMLDLVSAKAEGLLTSRRNVQKEQHELNERMTRIRKQIDEERKKGYQPGGQLIVKFYAPKATTSNVKLSYVVSNAGWKPAYDIRVEDLNSHVRLFYKANVYQNSGVKWDSIRITLSTGNPNESAQAPALIAWRLGYYRPVMNQATARTNTANEVAVMEYNVPLIQQNEPGSATTYTAEQISRMPTRTTTDMASLTGGVYQMKTGNGLSMAGARMDAIVYTVDGVQVRGAGGTNYPPSAFGGGGATGGNASVNTYVAVDDAGVATSFDIDLPYTIPSDGKEQIIAVKTYNLRAAYRHYAIPKMDKDAFLQAEVTGWEDLNLLPALTNVFYEDTYIGQGYIDMRNVKDTMLISLGRDKKVIVRREMDKKLRSVKAIGGNVREGLAFGISVKNTRKEPVNLILMDQFPLSIEKDIDVNDMEAKDATIDEKDGSVKWTLELAPAELKEVKMSYSVKYPKGRTLGHYK